MLNTFTNEQAEGIHGGRSRYTTNRQGPNQIQQNLAAAPLPQINVNPSISPTIIVTPFLRSSEYSFNLVGNSSSFNTSNGGSSTIGLT